VIAPIEWSVRKKSRVSLNRSNFSIFKLPRKTQPMLTKCLLVSPNSSPTKKCMVGGCQWGPAKKEPEDLREVKSMGKVRRDINAHVD
jgi:hypothetical protein